MRISNYEYNIVHNLGDIVYIKTDTAQLPRIITGINLKPSGLVVYVIQQCDIETFHYEIELSSEKDDVITFKH